MFRLKALIRTHDFFFFFVNNALLATICTNKKKQLVQGKKVGKKPFVSLGV